MLILRRKVNEALYIGDDVRVVVLESGHGGARLGIEAPPHVTILREEILEGGRGCLGMPTQGCNERTR